MDFQEHIQETLADLDTPPGDPKQDEYNKICAAAVRAQLEYDQQYKPIQQECPKITP